MKRTIFFCALLALFTGANAQKTTDYKEKHPYKDWVKLAPKLDDAFFTTPEAVRIADNVLLYQQTTGGWPKNIYMPAELTADEYQKALADKDRQQSHKHRDTLPFPHLPCHRHREIQRRCLRRHTLPTESAIPQRRLASVLAAPQRLLYPHHLQRQCNGERHEPVA